MCSIHTRVLIPNPKLIWIVRVNKYLCRVLLQLRWVCEIITVFGAAVYIFLSLKEIYHQGYQIFFQTLVRTAFIPKGSKHVTRDFAMIESTLNCLEIPFSF